jgi:hypothetical protein
VPQDGRAGRPASAAVGVLRQRGAGGIEDRELERAGVPVVAGVRGEHARACGNLFDLVEQGGLRHLGTVEVREAVKGRAEAAARRRVGVGPGEVDGEHLAAGRGDVGADRCR